MRTRLQVRLYRGPTHNIDLGNHPPLLADGQEDESPVRHAVHWRWLTGTILTGFISIFLMGGALMAALNNPDQSPGSRVTLELPSDSATQNVEFGEKGDRIHPQEETVASRQIVQVSTVTRKGERDYVKLRPFARIMASLATKNDRAADVPPYDAMKLFANTSAADAPDAAADSGDSTATGETAPAPEGQIYGANVDGEVSFKVSDFPLDDSSIDGGPGLDTPEVEQIVRAATNLSTAMRVAQVAAPGPAAGNVRPDRFTAAGVNVVPENVSNVSKSGIDPSTPAHYSEKILAVAKNKTFHELLLNEGAVTPNDADQIETALGGLMDLSTIHDGEKIRIAYSPDRVNLQVLRPIRVSVYDSGAHQATVALSDSNGYVRADEPNFVEEDPGNQPVDEGATTDNGGLPKIYDAIYETALEQQVPPSLIDQLVRMFAYDVDFASRIAPGDSIEILHSLPEPSEPDVTEPEILFAALTIDGVTKRFYRFRASDDGTVDYYDEEGKSAKKFLIRKPVPVGNVTSTFGWRVHPVLGYRRLHAGVDYGAPRGTPIVAAASGIIEKAGPSSGYGNFTLIKHANGYETGYGHQTAFAKGIRPGVRVRQGEVIGYVGSTGLSTGPHLHFEIRVNGTPVDPLRIRLPRGRVLQDSILADFDKERSRIDDLLTIPSTASAKTASAGG